MQADIAQITVERPVFQETTSLGAAFAAGLAVGFYSHQQIFDGHKEEHLSKFRPAKPEEWAKKRQQSWAKAVEKSFGLADLA